MLVQSVPISQSVPLTTTTSIPLATSVPLTTTFPAGQQVLLQQQPIVTVPQQVQYVVDSQPAVVPTYQQPLFPLGSRCPVTEGYSNNRFSNAGIGRVAARGFYY